MHEYSNQFLQLLGEMREEIIKYKKSYDTEYSSILSLIDTLEKQLSQGIINNKIIEYIGQIDIDKFKI